MFLHWTEQVRFNLRVLDLDLALRTEKLLAFTDSSDVEEETLCMSWERLKRLSIIFM
jgi:hypothetical protein